MGFTGERVVRAALLAATALLSIVPSAWATVPGQNGKIAFTSGGGIHVIEPDGSGETTVVPVGESPSWSPDGSRLAYSSEERHVPADFPGGLFVVNGDGSGRTMVRPATFISHPLGSSQDRFVDTAWSPDGRTIVYANVVLACAFTIGCHDAPTGVRAIGPDGNGDRPLIAAPAIQAAYSPDGSRIAWADHPFLFSPRVHVSSSDGTGDTVVADFDPDSGSASDPTWSPDGAKIAFVRLSGSNSEIWVMNADGTSQTRLTFGFEEDVNPAWSPDGTKIAWSNNGRLWIISADGSGKAPVTPEQVFGRNPDWQPLVGPRRADYKNASHFCKAEREFLGDRQFGEKYGNHGGCVSGQRK
jgi:Tol biopolymer transport system component